MRQSTGEHDPPGIMNALPAIIINLATMNSPVDGPVYRSLLPHAKLTVKSLLMNRREPVLL